jgi:hypothetical protein
MVVPMSLQGCDAQLLIVAEKNNSFLPRIKQESACERSSRRYFFMKKVIAEQTQKGLEFMRSIDSDMDDANMFRKCVAKQPWTRANIHTNRFPP